MRVSSFFLTFTLLFLIYTNVYCGCEDLTENMISCKKYSCMQQIGNGAYTNYKILGLNGKNLCVYIEKYSDHEMICYHSQDGMKMEKEYFTNVLNSDDQELNKMVNLRVKECFFTYPNYINQDDLIREAINNDDADILSQYYDMKSIFFDEEPVDKIVSEMEKFNTRSSMMIKGLVVENFDSKIVRLDAIVYFCVGTWKIWVNGKLFTDTKDLKIHSVNEDYVTFIWNVNNKVIRKEISDSKNVFFDDNNIKFVLYPKQEFDLEKLSIR